MRHDPQLIMWIGQLSERVTKLERRVNRIGRQVSDLWTWGRRVALVGAIWLAGLYTNATPEEKATLISALISSLGGGR